MKVLVVDDASFMRRVYTGIVNERGHEVVGEAGTGKEAIKLYKELRPDLVLMDIVMPDSTGLEAVKGILEFDPNARVVIITAAEEKTIQQDAMDLGVAGFLRKPPNPEHIAELVDEVSRRVPTESPAARMAHIYSTFLIELSSFVRTYFGMDVAKRLTWAMRAYGEKKDGLTIDKDLGIEVTVPDIELVDLNNRLNTMTEAGRNALADAIGGTETDEILKEAFKLIYQRTSEEEMQKLGIMFPAWLEAEAVRMEKANWEANLDMVIKRYDLRGGNIFLVQEARPNEAYRIFSVFSLTGTPSMLLSRTSPKEIRDRYRTGPTEMVWLTYNKVPEVECIEPTGSGMIYKKVSEFVKKHGRAIVLFDGIEYIISQTSFGGTQKLIQAINDDVMLTDAIMLLPIDTDVLDQKQVHFLSRELKVLNPGSEKGSQ